MRYTRTSYSRIRARRLYNGERRGRGISILALLGAW